MTKIWEQSAILKEPPSAECKIIVNARGMSGRTSPFTFILNEKEIGQVTAQEKEFPVVPGKYTARVQYLVVRSNSIEFELKKGEQIKLSWGVSLKFMLIPLIMALVSLFPLLMPKNIESFMAISGIFTIGAPFLLFAFFFLPGFLFNLRIEE